MPCAVRLLLRLQLGTSLVWLLTWAWLLGRCSQAGPSGQLSTKPEYVAAAESTTLARSATGLTRSAEIEVEGTGIRRHDEEDGAELSSTTPVTSGDPIAVGEEEEEGVVSLVPLFILLGSFLLIIVTCVVVCQRIRNSHKNRFHREEASYERNKMSPMSSYKPVCLEMPLPGQHTSFKSDKQSTLDNNGNLSLRSTLVKFVDETGLAAAAVTCPAEAAEKRKSILIDRDTTQGASSDVKGLNFAHGKAASAQAYVDAGDKNEPAYFEAAQVHASSSQPLLAVTYADESGSPSSAKLTRAAPKAMPPNCKSTGDTAKRLSAFNVVDGKSLKVAFLDQSVTVHGPGGRNFKLARIHSVRGSSSSSAIASIVSATSPSKGTSPDTARRMLSSGNSASVHSLPHRKRKHQMHSMSDSPYSSSSPSPSQELVPLAVCYANGEIGSGRRMQLEPKPSERAAHGSAVKRRGPSDARANRRRPVSAAPRLVGSTLGRPHYRLANSCYDESYEPDDGEDYDDSDADRALRFRNARQRHCSAAAAYRVPILTSGGES